MHLTQAVQVLLRAPLAQADLLTSLPGFRQIGEQTLLPTETWTGFEPGARLAYRQDCQAIVTVDRVQRPWDDGLAFSTPDDGWHVKAWGPYSRTNSLHRAAYQSWHWAGGLEAAQNHAAFLRLATWYADPVDAEPARDLLVLTDVAVALLDHLPAALGYFNAAGEVLRDGSGITTSLRLMGKRQLLPLDLWFNLRLFHLEDNWHLIDSVGQDQLGLPDFEAVFPDGYEFASVDSFLRSFAWYSWQEGVLPRAGDQVTGPGGKNWVVHEYMDPIVDPPRETLTLLPADAGTPPALVTQREPDFRHAAGENHA